jgi:hypothetical protein
LAAPFARAQVVAVDDFNDGDDEQWVHFCTLQQYGCFRDASSGSYCMGTEEIVPEDVFGVATSYWQASEQPAFSQGRLRAKVRAGTDYTNTALIMRWDAETLMGYVYIAEPIDGTIAILRIDGPSQQVLGSTTTELRVNQEWMFEAGAVGNELTFKVWPVDAPEPGSPQLILADSSPHPYSRGLFGVGVAHPVPGGASRLTACFDDLTFVPACSADFNLDGVPDSQDFFDFITALFDLDPRADFNRDGTLTSQDFFDFLTAFFAGCP